MNPVDTLPGRRARWQRAACVWLAASLLLAGSGPAVAEADAYRIDPEHLSVGFLVDHIGYAAVLGMFRSGSGSFRFDEASATLSELRVTVDTASVFTNHDRRDAHLRGADFLDSARHPRMVFTAAAARPLGERRFRVEGQLELLGQRRPLTLEVTWNKSGGYPFGVGGLFPPHVIGLSARGSFLRSDYGMDYAVSNGWVGDEVRLIIELEARRE